MYRQKENSFIFNKVMFRTSVLVLSLVFAYYGTLISLMTTWSGRPDYSHGFIVPLASLYFVYAMKNKLKAIDIKPNLNLGLAVTLAGSMTLMLGITGGMVTVKQFSILVVLPGLVILLLGIEMFHALLLPLGYLVLMVPLILDVALNPLHWPFQLFGARIASIFLSALGIPVYHTAQYIELPNIPLEVANACSGIRYLVSITALAIPLAYLTLDTWPWRVFLVASSLLIGILANPVRIAIIGLWVYHGGSILHGPGHMLQGYFVSVVGFGFLFTTAWIMSRKQAAARHAEGIHPGLDTKDNDDAGRLDRELAGRRLITAIPGHGISDGRRSGKAWALAISIVLATGIFGNTYSAVPVPLATTAKIFPLTLEGWEGRVQERPAGEIAALPGPDVEIRVAYSNSSGDVVHLQAGYYEYQRKDKKFVHYTLQELYEGAKTISLKTSAGQYLDAKQVIIRKNGRSMLVTYWYDVNGFMTSNNSAVKFVTATRGLFQLRTNGAIILLASEIHPESDVDHIHNNQAMLASSVYPHLRSAFSTH